MDYKNVIKKIKQGPVKPLYLLCGDEGYAIEQVQKAIIEQVLTPEEYATNLTKASGQLPIPALLQLIESVPFLGGKNMIVVQHTTLLHAGRKDKAEGAEESSAEKGSREDTWLLQTLSAMPDYTCLVLTTTEKVDKRRKLYKVIEKHGEIIELNAYKTWDHQGITGWIQDRLRGMNKSMTQEAIEFFAAIIGTMPQVSLGLIEQELEKVVLYTSGQTSIGLDDLEATLARVPEVSVFAMIDAVSRKETHKALECLAAQLAAGETPFTIMAMLAREVRLLWQIKVLLREGKNSRAVAAAIGLPVYICEKKIGQSRTFAEHILKDTLVALARSDAELKSGRTDSFVLEQLIVSLCQSQAVRR